MRKTDTVQFHKQVGSKGGVPGISIPPELMEYLKLNMTDTVTMIGENGKHGKFIAVWKKEVE